MIAWLVLLVLLAAEIAGLIWWLRREFLPFIFNGKAPIIYSAVLTTDFIIAWLVSTSETTAGTPGLALLAVLGTILLVVVAALTLFFQWVVKSDLNDIK
ncbi:MAG: hypothetical protein QOH93_1956 [Chloroflexia bacterium]|jgi:hypothetical protein|nr:hypothetical protein [Chloroflexia bacterium]